MAPRVSPETTVCVPLALEVVEAELDELDELELPEKDRFWPG